MPTVDRLTEGLQELRDSIAQTAQAAPQAARQEVRREGRAYFRGAVIASVITSLLVGIPLFLLAEQFSAYTTADQARAAQLQASADDIRRLAQGARDLGCAGE
jgi:type II secretory pathway component PulM